MNNSVTVIDIVAQVTDETASGARSAEANVSKLERSIMNLEKRIQSMKGKSKLEVAASLKDMASKGIQSVANAGKQIAGKIWTVTLKAKDLVTAPFRKIWNLVSNPITQMVTFAGVSLGAADTIGTFKDFEQGMANVKAISGATNAEFDRLNETAKRLGENTMFSAAQSAGAMENLATAGWKSNDIVSGMPGLLDLAASGDVDLANAASITSAALAQFKLDASESARIADVLAKTASSSMTNVGGLGESLKMAGTTAGALGYSIEDTTLALGLMGNAAVDASSAGTSLRAVLSRMSKQEGLTAEESNAMAAAMKKVGVTMTDETGKSKSLLTIMRDLRAGFKGMSETEKAATAANLAGMNAQAGLLAIVDASDEKFNELAAAIRDAKGAAQEMAGVKMDTLQGSLLYLQSAAEGVKISIGEKLQPYIRQLADWVTAHMPDIQNAVGSAVDFVLGKIDSLRERIRKLTSSPEWRGADTFWDKAKLAWDKLIAEPFDEWWNGKGKAWMAEKAGGIGKGIGTALKASILGLLGIDFSGAAEDGASIGKSFANGFADGFDGAKVGKAILEAIKNGLKCLVLDAATLLPGNKDATETSGLSAAALALGALKIAKIGGGIYKGGKAAASAVGNITGITEGIRIFNDAQKGGSAARSALVMAQGGALGLGVKSGAGIAGAASKAASILPAAAGAAASIVSAISAIRDISNAVKSEDKREKSAYSTSALVKSGGIAAGAAIGTLVAGPGVGTLIGAGIGGIAGTLGGNAIRSGYQKEAALEAEVARRAWIAREKSRYHSQTLKDAVADDTISPEGFARLFSETVASNVASRFGKLKLSAKEISASASDIMDVGDQAGRDAFQSASGGAERSYQDVLKTVSGLDKLGWKIDVGIGLDEGETADFQASLRSLLSDVSEQLDNAQYAASSAISLLVGDGGKNFFYGLDTAYAGIRERLSSLGEQLEEKISLSGEDGIITLDEKKELDGLRSQITEIADKLADAETGAKLETLKIRAGGAALDLDSFSALQSELAAVAQAGIADYNDSLTVGIASLNLQLSEGAITQAQRDMQLDLLKEGYEWKLDQMRVKIEGFQFETMADLFQNELDGILPEIQGTLAEKLQSAMRSAMDSGVDTWDIGTVDQYLGLSNLKLDDETKAEIASVMNTISASVSDAFLTGIDTNFDTDEAGNAVAGGVAKSIDSADRSGIERSARTLYGDTADALNEQFSGGFDIQTDVRVKLNRIDSADTILRDTSVIPVSVPSGTRGGVSDTTNKRTYKAVAASILSSPAAHAEGGVLTRPHLGLVAEDGPEAIIPLSGKRRERGISLWEQAGELLGVRPYAEGGICGLPRSEFTAVTRDAGIADKQSGITETANEKPAPYGNGGPGQTPLPEWELPSPDRYSDPAGGMIVPVTIENLTIEINVNGGGAQDPQELAALIKETVGGMTDEIAYQLAIAIQQAFANLPREQCGWGKTWIFT